MLNGWKMLVLDEVVPFRAAVTDTMVAIVTDHGILIWYIHSLKYYKKFWFVFKHNFFHQCCSLPKSHPYQKTVNVTI